MKTYTNLLEEALEAWTYVREGVMDELRNIPEKEMGFRPRPESRTVAELGQHIIQSGLLMSGELSRKDGDFRRKGYEALLREHGPGMERLRTRKALLDALARTQKAGEKVDKAVDQTGKSIQDAAKEAEKKVKEATK